jgi:hypothetical protein
VFDEYIERPSIPIRWTGCSRYSHTSFALIGPLPFPLGCRRHASLYIMTASVGLLI